MQIVPKIDHFKVVTYCNLVCGVWPIAFENQPVLRVLYSTHFWTLFGATSLFVIGTYIKLFSEMFTNFDIVIVTRIGTIATAYTMGLLRIYSVRNAAAKELIREVMMKEEIINNSKDDELIKIYYQCVRGNVLFNLVYMTMHYIDTISYCYVIYPFLLPKEPYFDPARNETVLQVPLLWDSWMPFDQQKYHFVAFFWEEFATTICALCNYGSDIFFYSFINYLIGQLDILHRILTEFETYKGKIQEQLRCDEEEADLVTLRLCIIEHQRILR
ncbi:unnamed protein product [Phyllotreta striolata]|uniref:Odorant receptor n=1 Tax=Phyllotreta striolata TaxID=444603 RepID=A0A9N9TV96_PHYSR|nr:unnamed protein product [Phyllotreta striolata]